MSVAGRKSVSSYRMSLDQAFSHRMDVTGSAMMLMTLLDHDSFPLGHRNIMLELPSDLGNTIPCLEPLTPCK